MGVSFRGFVVVVSLILVGSYAVNDRPIVGVLTQPTDGNLTEFGDSYIAASYVKYVESAGARVVPIFHNSTKEELYNVFHSVNAVLFPGGGANLNNTPLYYAAEYLWELMETANNKGDFFPIFGHCMGFELISILVSQNQTILQPTYGTENVTFSLNFSSGASSSKWMEDAPELITDILSTQPVCLNNHIWGIWTSTFSSTSSLNQYFEVISTNVDNRGTEFVSTWEGKEFPVFAMQWHAEKPQFEWNPQEDINHSFDAIISMQYFANFLVQQARLSSHKFSTYTEEYDSLIYNYNPIYSQEITGDFEQCYVF